MLNGHVRFGRLTCQSWSSTLPSDMICPFASNYKAETRPLMPGDETLFCSLTMNCQITTVTVEELALPCIARCELSCLWECVQNIRTTLWSKPSENCHISTHPSRRSILRLQWFGDVGIHRVVEDRTTLRKAAGRLVIRRLNYHGHRLFSSNLWEGESLITRGDSYSAI